MIDSATPLRDLPVAVIDAEATDFPGPDTHVVEVAVVHATLGRIHDMMPFLLGATPANDLEALHVNLPAPAA